MKLRQSSIAILGLILISLSSISAQQITDTTGNFLVEGRKLLQEKKYADVVNVMDKLLTRDPSNREGLHTIALSYSALGNNIRAREYYENALKFYPADVDAIIGVGVSYSNEGRGEKAQEYFEQAVQLDSNNVLALTNLGKQLSQNGKISQSLTPLRAAWKRAPKNQDVAFALGGAFATAKVNDSAEYYYKQSIMAGKDTFEVFFYLAAVLHRMGKIDDAIEGYHAAISRNPENKDCLRALGNLYIRTHQYSLAEEEFNRLIALDSTYTPGWQGLGVALALDNQYARADSVIHLLMYIDSLGAYDLLQTIRNERSRLKAEDSAKSRGSK